MNRFTDRNVQYPNRKKLTVVETIKNYNDEIEELIVDVERNEGNVTTEGTPLKADALNQIIQNMINTEINSIPLTDSQKLQSDLNTLNIQTKITNSLDLPVTWHRLSTISWHVKSGSGITITDNIAEITQNEFIQTAIIVATVTNGEEVGTKEFEIEIDHISFSDLDRISYDMQYTVIPTKVIDSFELPTQGPNYSTITWNLFGTNTGIVILGGKKVICKREKNDYVITLNATFSYGTETRTKQYNVKVIGYNCYTPKTKSMSLTQQKNSPKCIDFDITATEDFDITIENNNSDDLLVEVTFIGEKTARVFIYEKTALNMSTGNGSEIFTFNLIVKYSGDLIVGTIPCSVTYYYSSQTPED